MDMKALKKRLSEGAAKLSETAKPAAEKAAVAVQGAADVVVGGAKVAAEKAAGKVNDLKENHAKKPSTGSGVLDALSPAVPETEVTTPKAVEPRKKKHSPKP